MARSTGIALCIVRAINGDIHRKPKRSLLQRILRWLATLFALYRVPLHKWKGILFSELRKSAWSIDETAYVDSFSPEHASQASELLRTMDTMGFSGSTFFTTTNQAYLIKSIPRQFENSFFRDDLLEPYAEYMSKNNDSLLVRICDLLATESPSLGVALGLAPSHHIVMENLLYGEQDWQTWDLKPASYFFPERDIASGTLATEATKSRLADRFDDKIVLTDAQARGLMDTLEKDTQLLEQCNIVDYSLFLARVSVEDLDPFRDGSGTQYGTFSATPAPPLWRPGMTSSDGKHVYRAVILDFFWAKHKMQPRVMTLLVKAYNIIDRQGPMSITTSAAEYRTRFLHMCQSFVEVHD